MGDSTGNGSYFIQKPGSTGMYTWTDPCCIEFTVKEVTGDVRFQCYNTANSYVFDFSSVGNWRVTYDGTTFTRYLNGEQQGIPFDSALNNSRIGFIAQNGESVKFTDFMIYPI